MATLEKVPDSSQEWKHVAHRMRHTIMKHDNGIPLSDYDIIEVFKINNPGLNKRFESRKAQIEFEMGGMTEIWETFHGTPHAFTIATEGFKVSLSSAHNMFGKGIYFAPHSSKSNQYSWGANGGCAAHMDKACTSCERLMLLCMCVMGRQFNPKAPKEELPPGYHSIVANPETNSSIAKSLKYPEFLIKDGDQVKPLLLVKYRIVHHGSAPSISIKNAVRRSMQAGQIVSYTIQSYDSSDSSSEADDDDEDDSGTELEISESDSDSGTSDEEDEDGRDDGDAESDTESSDSRTEESDSSDDSGPSPSSESDGDSSDWSDSDSD